VWYHAQFVAPYIKFGAKHSYWCHTKCGSKHTVSMQIGIRKHKHSYSLIVIIEKISVK